MTPTGPSQVFTVTASSGTGVGTLGLDVVDDSVRDAQANPLGGPSDPNGFVRGRGVTR